MRRVVLTLLASLGVAAALTVTASSTADQAHKAGFSGLPVAGLVVLLEVVNVVGAWAVITDPRSHVKVESLLSVVGASLVTGICGALTYGPLGAAAPIGLLVTVHGVSRMWTAPARPAPAKAEPPRAAAPAAPVAVPAHRDTGTPVLAPSDPTPADPPTEPTPAALPDPTPTPAPTTTEGADDEAIVAALLTRPALPGRDAIRSEFGVGSKRAARLLDGARSARRPHLVQEVTP